MIRSSCSASRSVNDTVADFLFDDGAPTESDNNSFRRTTEPFGGAFATAPEGIEVVPCELNSVSDSDGGVTGEGAEHATTKRTNEENSDLVATRSLHMDPTSRADDVDGRVQFRRLSRTCVRRFDDARNDAHITLPRRRLRARYALTLARSSVAHGFSRSPDARIELRRNPSGTVRSPFAAEQPRAADARAATIDQYSNPSAPASSAFG